MVVATANPGKLREFRSLLEGLPFELTSLAELRLPSPDETGRSFLENALLKARHAADLSGSAAVADDSGLEVDALNGAPGIYSARYAGSGADDRANNAKLMQALEGVPRDKRQARYRCALVLIENAQDAAPLVAEADWEGLMLDAPRGAGGFGYDPYFWLPELGKSAAELPPAEKNRLSHRGKAMLDLRRQLVARGKLAVPQ
ncbi:MAG TPA: RdgB/HAM1 family non-canonical purine NTP pyrophosphatase [Steroidobacteraceae bacterium]